MMVLAEVGGSWRKSGKGLAEVIKSPKGKGITSATVLRR